MPDKFRPLVIAALLLAIGAIHFWTLRPGHDWGGDFSMYVHHAKNLAEGIPYAETGYIYNPAYATIGPPTYPPVCPILLAPVYMLRGLDLEAMKLVMLASLLLFLLFVFLSFRAELPFWHAAAIMALVGLNRCYLGDVNEIGSDLPFMALLYLTIYTIQKAYDTATSAPRLRYLLPAAVLMALSYGTRTVGIVLLPSLLWYEWLRSRRITRAAVVVILVFAAVAAAESLLARSEVSYFDQYNVGPSVFLHNGGRYIVEFAAFWHNGYYRIPGALLFLALTALCVLGYVAAVRRRLTFIEIFPVVYMVAVLLFPGYAGRRYLLPIFPLYLLFAAHGLDHAWLTQRAAFRRTVFALLLVSVTISYGASYGQLELDIVEGIAKPESAALFDYLSKRTDANDVMIFIKPRVLALLTARRSSAYHMPENDAELWDYMDRIGATHLVVVENSDAFAAAEDPVRLQYLRDFASRHASRLTRVFANADFSVFRLGDRAADRQALVGAR